MNEPKGYFEFLADIYSYQVEYTEEVLAEKPVIDRWDRFRENARWN